LAIQCDPTTSPSAVALEMEQLFVKQSSLEVYFEWLDSVIERRVSEVSLNELMKGCKKEKSGVLVRDTLPLNLPRPKKQKPGY